MQTRTECRVSGRFTLDDLRRLLGTAIMPVGVAETQHPEEERAAAALLCQAAEYLEMNPGATEVDIADGQIVNVR